MSSDEQITRLTGQVKKLEEQVIAYESQVSGLKNDLQLAQKNFQFDSARHSNQIQGLGHLLVDLISQSRDNEQIRQQMVGQRIHHLLTAELNNGELSLSPFPLNGPPQLPPPGILQAPINLPHQINPIQQNIQLQQQQQLAQEQALQDRKQQHSKAAATATPVKKPLDTPAKTAAKKTPAATATPAKLPSQQSTPSSATKRKAPKRKANDSLIEKASESAETEPEHRDAASTTETPDLTTTGATESGASAASPKRRKKTEGSHSESNFEGEVGFARAPNTVLEIWNEYTMGVDGLPSIKSLEEEYKTAWRRDPATSKKYNRRKPIYNAIERGLQKGLGLDECIKLLEDVRWIDEAKNLKQPIGWLSISNLPDELKQNENEEKKDDKKEKAAKEASKTPKGKAVPKPKETAKAAKETPIVSKSKEKKEAKEDERET